MWVFHVKMILINDLAVECTQQTLQCRAILGLGRSYCIAHYELADWETLCWAKDLEFPSLEQCKPNSSTQVPNASPLPFSTPSLHDSPPLFPSPLFIPLLLFFQMYTLFALFFPFSSSPLLSWWSQFPPSPAKWSSSDIEEGQFWMEIGFLCL